jgi:hypothetical protein
LTDREKLVPAAYDPYRLDSPKNLPRQRQPTKEEVGPYDALDGPSWMSCSPPLAPIVEQDPSACGRDRSRVPLERGAQLMEGGRPKPVVIVEEEYGSATSLFQSPVAGCAAADVVLEEDRYEPSTSQGSQPLTGAIRRGIVDDHDLVRGIRLREYALDGFLQEGKPIAGRDDHRDLRRRIVFHPSIRSTAFILLPLYPAVADSIDLA